jgi:DNA-binding response OmpR family regulator/two-component sensor histidine kinase
MTPVQEQGLRHIESKAKGLLQLINTILELAKFSAGKMEIVMERFRVKTLVEDVASVVDALAAEKGLKITWEVDPEIIFSGDKSKFSQILGNLTTNAVKFTHQGGATVRVEPVPGQPIFRLVVQDTGIGIPPELIPTLFENFRQLDGSTTRRYGGTGLGLALVKKLVELMGGTIHVQSLVGKGSTFTVTLPYQVPESAVVVRPSHPQGSAPTRPVLLGISEDSRTMRVLSDALSGSGWAFAGAHGPEEGLALARDMHPAAVVVDASFKGRSGWDVLKQLRSETAFKTTPIIVACTPEERESCTTPGAEDYLLKPLERQDVLLKLEPFRPRPKTRVLVVDDDPSMVRLFEALLKKEGFQVGTAFDGGQALERMTADVPDVLFLDLMMPQMTGFDVLAEMIKKESFNQVRVFVMTAKDLSADETASLETRVDFIIQKGSKELSEILKVLRARLKNSVQTQPKP